MPIRKAITVTPWMLALLACTPAHRQSRFLPARGWVSDFADAIDSDPQKRITVMARELDQKTHTQIAVVTVEAFLSNAMHWGYSTNGQSATAATSAAS